MLRTGPVPAAELPSAVSVATDIDSVASDWEELAERVGASPFLRPGWIEPWLRAFGSGTPELILVHRDGRLAGVLPMQRRRRRLYSAANWHSPVFGPVVADDAAHAELLAHLFDGRGSVELSLLDGEAAHMAETARRAGRRVVDRTITSGPVVRLSGCFDGYERGLSRNRRRSLRRGLRALQQQGEVSFEVHEGLDGLDRVLEEVFEVEASGWKGRAGTAIASRPETRRFYADVARWAASRGWLRLSLLRLDGRAIACDYSIEFEGTSYSLKSGYDEAHRAAGPGALLLREQVRSAFERGLNALELLGHVDPFKLSWTDQCHDKLRVHAFDDGPAGFVAWSCVAGRVHLRRAIDRIQSTFDRAKARGCHALGSISGEWESLGLELMPGLV